MLVGINLLREGLDLPEVSLVAILDADKEGFLRSETSLIQTIGRAARNAEGRVVLYADKDGNQHKQAARAVCVAGNSFESPRLLLNSASSMFADGLANSSGQVGRNYMRHMFGFALAIMPKPVNFHRGARQSGLVYDEQDHNPERGFAGGYLFETLSLDPLNVAAFVGGWGPGTSQYNDSYTHLAGLFLVGEDPPQADNRIRLHPDRKDHNGLPVPVLDYTDHANTIAMREHGVARARAIYESLGAVEFWGGEGPPVGCHNMGVARMSANPEDGVTNGWGQTHDIDNLFITDGSFMTSAACVNPSLTYMAFTARACDYAVKQMGEGLI